MKTAGQELLEAVKPLIATDVISYAVGLIEDDEERYPKTHNPDAVNFYDEHGFSGLKAMDFIRLRDAVYDKRIEAEAAVIQASKIILAKMTVWHPSVQAGMSDLSFPSHYFNDFVTACRNLEKLEGGK